MNVKNLAGMIVTLALVGGAVLILVQVVKVAKD
jgi:hypothetical protein